MKGNVGVSETALSGVVSPPPAAAAARGSGVVVQVERAARPSAARGRGFDVHALL